MENIWSYLRKSKLRLLASALYLLGMSMSQATAETTIPDDAERAIFAGGCFWCIEAELQELDGVYAVTSGYTGGHTTNPTYDQIGRGNTGHAEAVEVLYDAEKISYQKLLEIFWSNIDPTDEGGQFFDRGSQYRTEIFYLNDEQRALAEESKRILQSALDKPIVTSITKASTFYTAEEHHQDYYKKNPIHYNAYKLGSQRERTLDRVWGDKRPATKAK